MLLETSYYRLLILQILYIYKYRFILLIILYFKQNKILILITIARLNTCNNEFWFVKNKKNRSDNNLTEINRDYKTPENKSPILRKVKKEIYSTNMSKSKFVIVFIARRVRLNFPHFQAGFIMKQSRHRYHPRFQSNESICYNTRSWGLFTHFFETTCCSSTVTTCCAYLHTKQIKEIYSCTCI